MTVQPLKVGAELDAEVWRRLFGYTVRISADGKAVYRDYEREELGTRWKCSTLLDPLSTDLAGAWTVVEELRTRGWLWTIKEMPDGFPYVWDDSYRDGSRIWRRSFVDLQWMPSSTVDDGHKRIWTHPIGMGASVPEAICRAALMALEESEHCPCRTSSLSETLKGISGSCAAQGQQP